MPESLAPEVSSLRLEGCRVSMIDWIVACCGLFADAGSELPPWLSGLIGSVPTAGILVWHLYYMTAVEGPRIERAHAEERESAEKRHIDHMNLVISNSRTDLMTMWKEHRESQQELTKVLHRLSEQIAENDCKYPQSHHHPPNRTSG